jgi:hypothetical protein
MPIARVEASSCVAATFELVAHRLVTFVYPGCKARDAGRRVRSPHRVDCFGALSGSEIALEERVVIDGALGAIREDGDPNAW